MAVRHVLLAVFAEHHRAEQLAQQVQQGDAVAVAAARAHQVVGEGRHRQRQEGPDRPILAVDSPVRPSQGEARQPT